MDTFFNLNFLYEYLKMFLIINILFYLVWVFSFMLLKDKVYSVLNRIFPMEKKNFMLFSYGSILIYKMLVVIFVLVPFLTVYLLKN